MTDAQTPTDPKARQGSSATIDALIAGCGESCPRCHPKSTSEQLKAIFPQAPDEGVDRNKPSSQAQPWVQSDGVQSSSNFA